MITTENGVLFQDGRMLNAVHADQVAREHGFQWAEELVEHLDPPPTKLEEFQFALEHAWNQAQCVLHDHVMRDCSHAGPDSGDMDHECTRCGRYWSVPIY